MLVIFQSKNERRTGCALWSQNKPKLEGTDLQFNFLKKDKLTFSSSNLSLFFHPLIYASAIKLSFKWLGWVNSWIRRWNKSKKTWALRKTSSPPCCFLPSANKKKKKLLHASKSQLLHPNGRFASTDCAPDACPGFDRGKPGFVCFFFKPLLDDNGSQRGTNECVFTLETVRSVISCSKARVSSACFWLCSAIFSLNFRGFVPPVLGEPDIARAAVWQL